MHVDRELLLNALQLTSAGLSEREVVDQAGCYVFQKKRVITFNGEVACSCGVEVDITGAVPAEPLRNILAKLKEPQLEITEKDNELIIKGKGKRVNITKEKEISLPLKKLGIPKKWKTLPEGFSEAVDFVQDCAGRDEAKFILTCIHIHPKYVEAYDNWQFARFNLKLDLKRDFLVRQPSLKAMVALAMTEFSEGKGWVHFRNSDKLTISCRRWKDEYQDLSPFTKIKAHPITMPKSLIDGADRAEVFAEHSVPKTQKCNIHVDISPRWIELIGEGPYGKYHEKKKIKYSGQPFSFLIPPRMLIQLLKRENRCFISDKILKVEMGTRAMFITSVVQAPTTLKKKKRKK